MDKEQCNEDYPIGGSLEHYDIEKEKEIIESVNEIHKRQMDFITNQLKTNRKYA